MQKKSSDPRKTHCAAASPEVCIGTAGWSIPRLYALLFPRGDFHLKRYSQVLRCAEINSSFYRSHKPGTYARWADSTPEYFRFSVKAPKAITHDSALAPTRAQLQAFLEEVRHLTEKLGPILFQLPPRQSFIEAHVREFLSLFRDLFPEGYAAIEPRHPGWFSPEAAALLKEFHMSRVVADPLHAPEGIYPAGDVELIYFRLHGSPRIYYSSYSAHWLAELAVNLSNYGDARAIWCIFDNTASGAAVDNALTIARDYPLTFRGRSANRLQ